MQFSMKFLTGTLVACLIVAGCSGDTRTTKTVNHVADCKKHIGNQDYAKAIQSGTKAVEADADSADAHYCLVAANLGAMVQSVASIISLLANANLAPGQLAPKIDGKQLLGSVLAEIEDQMAAIDRETYVLASMDDPTFEIDKFVLALDPADLIKLVAKMSSSVTVTVTGDLAIDLKGTWDRTEVHVLGGGINAVQALLDFLFAHNLTIDSLDASFSTSEGVARFLLDNKKLAKLDTDPESTARLQGDGERRKGVKNDLIAALSYLVGRDAAIEKVAPANAGLVDAIKKSTVSNDTTRVVQWTDADGDGIPEKIKVPAIEGFAAGINIQRGAEKVQIPSEFDNPINHPAFWQKLIDLGKGLRDNLEGTGGAVSLKAVLDEVVAAVKAGHITNVDPTDGSRLTKQPVPDLVQLNLGEYFKAPKALREMLPYYFTYTTNGTTQIADIAWEKELYAVGGTNSAEKVGVTVSAGQGPNADFGHFNYTSTPEVINGSLTVQSYTFADFGNTPPAAIAPDGVKASAEAPMLVYVALQNPSFGGALGLNLASVVAGASSVSNLGNFEFNQGLNGLISYYCLDLNKDLGDMIDDAKYTVPCPQR